MTGLFCKDYTDEANPLLRAFMIYFNSIPLGLFAFTLSFYGPVYFLLCCLTNRGIRVFKGMSVIQFISEHSRPIFDIVLGLGVAARHFEGAMSWILPLSNRLWLSLGFICYLAMVHMGTLMRDIGS